MGATRKLGVCGALAAVLLLTAGCIDSLVLVEVTKDGSGTIVVWEFYSPMLTEAMGGMEQAMTITVDGKPVQTAGPEAKKTDFVAEAARQKAKEFGPGVEQVEYAEKTNEEGWKGFHAKYRFKDISKVKVATGTAQGGGDTAGAAGATGENSGPTYSFRFTPGQTSVLEIVPAEERPAKDAAAPDKGAVQTPPGMDAQAMQGMQEMGGAMAAQMMQMAGPMLKGMHLRLLVTVPGRIAETNATFRWQRTMEGGVVREGITVMDVQLDKLMANAQAAALMTSQDPKEQAKLAALKIDGVQLEEPAKTIRVGF